MASSSSTPALTVFVATGAPEGLEVKDLIGSWTRAGILRPSLWVTPGDVSEDQSGPPRVQATHMGVGGDESVDLFTAIGRERLDLVRVVVANLVIDADSIHTDVTRVGELVAGAVNEALPRRTGPDSVESGTRLHRTCAIIPVSGVTGVPESLLIGGWDVNTVVSPEDRPDLDRASIYVRHPENFSGHAAAALAAIGGVLDGIPSSAIDEVHADSTTSDRDVFVSRFTVRSVIGDDVFDDLVKATLDTGSFGGAGPSSALRNVRISAHPQELADSGAHFILSTPEWAPMQRPLSNTPSTRSQGFWRALWRAIKFNLRMFAIVMGWVLSKMRVRVERQVTEMIVGNDAGISVTLGAGPADQLSDVAEQQLAANEARLKRQIETDSQYVPYPVASAWSTLKRLTLGLADGGDLPPEFPEPRVSGTREALPLSRAVPNPANRWERSDDTTFSPTDIISEREHVESLKEHAAHLVAERKEMLAAQKANTADVEKAKQALAAAKKKASVKSTAASKKSEDSATAEHETDTRAAAHTGAQEELDELRQKAKAFVFELTALDEAIQEHEATIRRFTSWLAAQASLIRTVLSGLVDRGESLTASSDEEESNLDARPPRRGLERAQRGLKVAWIVIAVLWVIATGVLVLAYFNEELRSPLSQTDLLVVWGVVTGIAIFILLIANHAFYKSVQKYEWQVAQRLAAQQNAADLAIYNKQEAHRTDALYDGAQDWADILGSVVHGPWHLVDPENEELSNDVIGALPASMGVAELSSTGSIPHHSLVAAARVAYHNGWLGDAFATIVDDFEHMEPGGEGGYLAIESDNTIGSFSPRKRFVEFLADPDSRTTATEKAVRRLRTAVESEDVRLPTRQVTRMGRYSDSQSIDEDAFFRAAASAPTLFSKDVFDSRGLQSRAHYVHSSMAWLPGQVARSVEDQSLSKSVSTGANAMRVDLSRRVRPSDLSLFGEHSAQADWTSTIPVVGPDTAAEEPEADAFDWR